MPGRYGAVSHRIGEQGKTRPAQSYVRALVGEWQRSSSDQDGAGVTLASAEIQSRSLLQTSATWSRSSVSPLGKLIPYGVMRWLTRLPARARSA